MDKHRGAPVFFSVLSNAHTLRTGSDDRSSAIVTSSDVDSTCFMCVMEPVSNALKVRTTLNSWESMRTTPSELPRKRFSEPVVMQLMSFYRRLADDGKERR